MDSQAGDIPTRILPNKMDSYYTEHYVLTKIEGFFNQFALVQIADLKHKRVTTMLNFFGNKVYHKGKNGELPAAIIGYDHLKYNYTGETSVIGGLDSERIEVNTDEEQFDIFCTKEFKVRRPNIVTPYHSVDYPLTNFPIQLSLLDMRLSCIEYEHKIIESEIFIVPDDYREVSRQVMEEIINSLFTKE